MPDHRHDENSAVRVPETVPAVYDGEPMVAREPGSAGGAHAIRVDPASSSSGGVVDNGDSLLTSTHVAVVAPRHRIQRRAPILWTIEGIWSWLILVGLQVGWYYYDDNVMGFWNLVALVVTVPFATMGIIVAPWWKYLVARWDVSDSAICSRSGWWTTHFRIAPLSRLQTVYTTRNLFERLMGLATVHASTASAHGSVEIRGLLREDAERLAEHLLSIAQLDEGDAT